MIVDWNNPDALRETADAMLKAVDTQIENANTEGYRSHLGASVVGNECLRYLFYHFHWMHKETYPGRMLRLFEVGHGLEVRVRHWLKSIGFQFIDGLDETGTQLKFSDLYGHFGGSVDGVFIAPDWGILEPTGLECKTSGTGSPFNDLDKKGMRETKEQHYIQNSVYGKGLNFKNILYVCENKNDSSWYFELVPLDLNVAEGAYKKAQFVIFDAKEPPKGISNKRNYYLCGMCKMQPICFDGVACDVNCRSCSYSRPIENADWFCTFHNSIIPKDFIPKGCDHHAPIQK